MNDAGQRRATRREVVCLGLGIGVAAGAGGRVLAAAAQSTTPEASAAPAMSPDEVARAIAAEGAIVVANWAYEATVQIVDQFERAIKQRYGVEVTLDYRTSPNPPDAYALVAQKLAAGEPAPYDVMAIEEKFWARAMAEDPLLPRPFLPSPLVPNAERVDGAFRHFPTAVAFQASSTIGVIYNRATVDPIADWTDLADPRLKGRLALPSPDNSYVAPVFFVGLASALGKDDRNLDQMRSTIDFVVDRIAPNAVSFDDDVETLFLGGGTDVVLADSGTARVWQARGRADATFATARSGQPMINGYLWIPRGVRHPVLAQLFVDWRLSNDGQLPGDTWELSAAAWLQYHEGLLGPSYAAAIPDWLASDEGHNWLARTAYFDHYPTQQTIRDRYRPVDWTAYDRDVDAWLAYYAQRLGQ